MFLPLVLLFIPITPQSARAENEHEAKVEGSIAIRNQSVIKAARLSRISSDKAMQIAIAKAPGRVIKSALENEDGYLIYAIKTESKSGARSEVLIDAGTGKVLDIQVKRAGYPSEEEED